MKRTKYILDFTEEFEKDVQDELELKRKKNNELTTRTYYKILRLMLHDQLKDSSRPGDNNKKGCVIAFENKKDLHMRRGKIITSLQQLVKFNPSHFTQGSYPDFKLHTDKKGVVSGFVKDNLNQLNFSVVDIDSKKKSVDEIVDCARLNGLFPTLVLETDRGYQTYFVFSEALYLNGKTYKWILRSAELVNDNLKKMYQKYGFDVDMGCTTYQICRFPQCSRIKYYDINNVWSYDEYAQWSLKQTEYSRLPRKDKQSGNGTSGSFTLVKGDLPGWVRALRGFSGFKQGDRNTCLYTVSLSYRDSGIPYEQAIEELTPWMVSMGLKKNDVKRTIESAYKGTKHARKSYFEPLLQSYGLEASHVSQIDWSRFTEKQLRRYWALRKPARERENRKNSHYSEWMEDIMELLEEQQGHLEITNAELQRKLGISRNNHGTLNIVLEKLVEQGKIELTKGTSRKSPLIINQKAATKQPETVQEPETTGAMEYRKQELVEDVARSLIGRVTGREIARVRVVKLVGVKKYQQLTEAFITDPENFVGGSEALNRIRNTDSDELSSG